MQPIALIVAGASSRVEMCDDALATISGGWCSTISQSSRGEQYLQLSPNTAFVIHNKRLIVQQPRETHMQNIPTSPVLRRRTSLIGSGKTDVHSGGSCLVVGAARRTIVVWCG